MENQTCKTCGGTLKKVNNYYICEFCGNKWEIVTEDDGAVARANAWRALRNGDFENATALFEEILVKNVSDHEAYWGKALSSSCITYVTDLNENKKVPTCNNITEESFLLKKDVKKAIELAPKDIAEEYKKQAEQIDRIRIEWLNKASKEPEYDIFISYKDSDRENGIERTQDSIDVQDLYNALVAEGYKVFFSRISLRDKISEQFEPYIYNAIKTAKVMIVFGEKAEYFNSTWIKNEWIRFKARIEKKEKHPNSLIVVYKGVDPADLPIVLKTRQCLNAGDMTFLSDLTKHIKKVIELSKQINQVEKIKVEGGKISKKATKLAQETLKTREVGQGAIVETSIDDKQTFSLVKTYISAGQFDEADSMIEDLLFNNPSYAEAIWASLLVKKRVKNDNELFSKSVSLEDVDYSLIEKALNSSSKEFAEEKLNFLYKKTNEISDEDSVKILKIILPFNFDNRIKCLKEVIQNSIDNKKYNTFTMLLSTLDNKKVNDYINYNLMYAEKIARKNKVDNKEHEQPKEIVINSQQNLINSQKNQVINTFKTPLGILGFICSMLGSSGMYIGVFFGGVWIAIAAGLLIVGIVCSVKAIKQLKNIQSKVNEKKNIVIARKNIPSNEELAQFYGCINRILEVEEGNMDALLLLFNKRLLVDFNVKEEAETAEKILKYSNCVEDKTVELINYVLKSTNYDRNNDDTIKKGSLIKQLLKYYSEDFANIKDLLLQCGNCFLGRSNFGDAEYFYKLILDFDKGNSKAYWGICLAKVKAENEANIKKSNIILKDIPEFNKFLTLIDEKERFEYLELSKKQISSTQARKKTKKVLSIVIPIVVAIIIAVTSIIIVNSINNKKDEELRDGVIYSLGIGEYSVTGLGTNRDGVVEILSEYKGKPVTSIGGSAFSGCKSLTSIEIPDSVTSIGDRAFSGCSSLKSIKIPNSVTSIGAYAFIGCSGLTSITIPNSVTSIGGGAFWGCSSLQKMTIPFVGAKAGVTSSDSYQYPFGYIFGTSSYTGGTYTIQDYYGSSTSLPTYDSYYIPSSLRKITVTGGNILYGAFYNCSSLTSIEIPDGVTSIEDFAFDGCKSLTSITIPNSVTSIGAYAFSGCSSLTSITIPDSVTSIGKSAFSNCDSLTSVTIPDSVTSIGSGAFQYCDSLTSITIPNSVTSIGDSAFDDCRELKSIEIPNSVTSIGDYAFSGCSSLTSIEIPNSVTSIGSYAFDDCSSLTSITIGNGVQSIGSSILSGCSSLEEITIPFVGAKAGVTSSDMYQYPFGYIFATGSYTGGTKTEQYYYGSSTSSTTYGYYYIPSSLKSVTVTGGNILYGAFYGCSGLTSVTIGNSVTSIGDRAFYKCSSLTSVKIGDGVQSIGDRAFSGCSSLTSIEISNSVTSIGSYAFSDCSSLTSIEIPDGVTSIGSYAFYKCSWLTSVTIGDSVTSIGDDAFRYCDSLTSVTIGNSVTSIGSYAFYGCSGLTSVTIPNSVTSIGADAFYYCGSLTSITFSDTTTWYRTIGSTNWNNKTGGTLIDLTNSEQNAKYFSQNLYYWYKI